MLWKEKANDPERSKFKFWFTSMLTTKKAKLKSSMKYSIENFYKKKTLKLYQTFRNVPSRLDYF